MQRYLATLVDLVMIGHDQVRLGVIQYAKTTQTLINLNDYNRGDRFFLDTLSRMSKAADRDRRLNLALEEAIEAFRPERGARDYANDYLLIVTTGKQTGPMDQYITRFRQRNPAALVYVLAFGSDFLTVQEDNTEIKELIGNADRRGEFWVVQDDEYSNDILDQFALSFIRDKNICPPFSPVARSK
jgi:hypothetical protein